MLQALQIYSTNDISIIVNADLYYTIWKKQKIKYKSIK